MSLPRQLFLLLACVLGALWSAVGWDYVNSESVAEAQLREQTSTLSLAFAEHTELTFSRGEFVLLQLREAWLANPKAFPDAIKRYQENGITWFVADIQVSAPNVLRAGLSSDKPNGREEKMQDIAARAKVPSKLLVLDPIDFRALTSRYPDLAAHLHRLAP